MILSWQPVIWIDVLGALAILVLAALCVVHSLKLLKKEYDQHFHHYLFLLSLSLALFAVSRSFSHIVKQALFFLNHQHTWQQIAPFSGALNTSFLVIAFTLGIYFERSRKIYQELEQHKNHLTSLVTEQTTELIRSNDQLTLEISDRIQTEKELEDTIAEFSAVMDSIDYGILFMDNELRAQITNRAFRKIWGMEEDFVSGHPTLRDLIAYNRDNHIYGVAEEDFEAYLDERETRVYLGTIAPMEMKREDGTTLQYQCIVLPNGWRMLTYFDITELKKTQEKLVHSQKMEAIGLMAGGVAHDLNNILTGVVSYPDMLLLKLPSDSPLRRPLEIIKESGQRAAQVVADLLTVARGAASNREIHSLNSLLTQYLSSPEGMAMLTRHKGIKIKTDLANKPGNIACSPMHIKKCLMNLLNNGAESIDGEGTLLIETRSQEINQMEADFTSLKAGKYAVLSVSDTGSGIADEDIDHIFEPFYTKKVMGRSGTGLGLAIVWNTVQEHGGTITVKSDEHGTCFELYFPASEKGVAAATAGARIDQLQGTGERILIVDDEAQQRDIARKMLSLLGYRVREAASGEEAVSYLEKKAVDLVILDMLMPPGINGCETYEQIIRIHPGQPALIASGFSENSDVERAQKLGAGCYIRKPYTIEQLGTAVLETLNSARTSASEKTS